MSSRVYRKDEFLYSGGSETGGPDPPGWLTAFLRPSHRPRYWEPEPGGGVAAIEREIEDAAGNFLPADDIAQEGWYAQLSYQVVIDF